jgi:hypothetical protein
MAMNDVKLVGATVRVGEHARFERAGVERRIGTHGARSHRLQFRRGLGIRGREQRYVVPQPDELLGKIRDNPFGATVAFGRDRFSQRSNLGDTHLSNANKWPRLLLRQAAPAMGLQEPADPSAASANVRNRRDCTALSCLQKPLFTSQLRFFWRLSF